MNNERQLNNNLEMRSFKQLLLLGRADLSHLSGERLRELYKFLQEKVAISSHKRDTGDRLNVQDNPKVRKAKEEAYKNKQQNEVEQGFIKLSELRDILEERGLNPETMKERGI